MARIRLAEDGLSVREVSTMSASAPIHIAPAKEEPGLVAVTAASALPAGSAVEIILDARAACFSA